MTIEGDLACCEAVLLGDQGTSLDAVALDAERICAGGGVCLRARTDDGEDYPFECSGDGNSDMMPDSGDLRLDGLTHERFSTDAIDRLLGEDVMATVAGWFRRESLSGAAPGGYARGRALLTVS